jgi:hypothetical protein
MHTLYDSDTFAVMHVLANAPGEDAPRIHRAGAGAPRLRDC